MLFAVSVKIPGMIYGSVPIWVSASMMSRITVLSITTREMDCKAMNLRTELSIKIRKERYISAVLMALPIFSGEYRKCF